MVQCLGNTPTCVGKTIDAANLHLRLRKHPHVRGEDLCSSSSPCGCLETPPRAWGRRTCCDARRKGKGNTPTCVGKTSLEGLKLKGGEKHPHVRGEDFQFQILINRSVETPPRAWGRRVLAQHAKQLTRNTPTCVGKTKLKLRSTAHSRKHPHVRGEDLLCLPPGLNRRETPPRAWGRQLDRIAAEAAARVLRKHPHVRGEDRRGILSRSAPRETPPRAWGRLGGFHEAGRYFGKHPHVRGEDPKLDNPQSLRKETPPRAWGRPILGRYAYRH